MLRVWLIVMLIAGGASAQVEGDLIVTVAGTVSGSQNLRAIMAADPSSGRMTTINAAYSYPQRFPTEVRMAEDNSQLVVSETKILLGLGYHGELRRNGSLTTIRGHAGIQLDYDATWITAGHSAYGLPPPFLTHYTDELAGITPFGVRPYFSVRSTVMAVMGYQQLLIDRDPGAPAYVVGSRGPLLAFSRMGPPSTITNFGGGVSGLALDDFSGDYVVAYAGALVIVSKSGQTRRRIGLRGSATSLWMNGDRTAWVGLDRQVAKVDLGTGATTTFVAMPPAWRTTRGLTVYGSRRIVCNGSGKPGSAVRIDLQSRRTGDAGKAFALACSLARRPGARMRTGDWVHLDVTDNLFVVSASNLAPSVFQGFRGVTDNNGHATAYAKIPSGIPPGTGITVFVAGIIYDASGVRTVTNTHWFVLT